MEEGTVEFPAGLRSSLDSKLDWDASQNKSCGSHERMYGSRE
jgi:hypothetical protein